MKLIRIVAVVAAVFFVTTSGAVTKDDYEMKFTVTIADGVGAKTATDAVIPIKVSETSISGFKYSDFKESDGTDLYIVDGNDTALDYQIDMWNTSGETTIWVKVPSIAAGTVLTVYYKGAKNTDNTPNKVWSLFLGVWHFNETSVNGTSANAYEATGNAALTGYDTPKTTSVDGKFGLSRQPRKDNYQNNGVGGVFLPAMTLNGKFAISGWFNIANCGYPTFFSTKKVFGDVGFHYYIASTWSMANVELTGDGHTDGWNSVSTGGKVGTGSWNRYCFVHDSESTENRNFWLYINGEYAGFGKNSKSTVTDNGKEICVGNVSCDEVKVDNGPGCVKDKTETGAGRSLCGQMDEIRIQSYANFNADREYFEGAIAQDSSLTMYSPAAPCSSLAVDLSFEVIKNMNPAEIRFTATVAGATGTCEYSWDFDNDGVVDRVSNNSVETWTCTKAGVYHGKVSVLDSASVSGEITTLGTYVVNDIRYLDGDAAVDGDGTQLSPFNNLRSLAESMNGGDRARIKGTVVIGDEAEAIVFDDGDLIFDKWGDVKPLITSTNEVYVAKNGILVFNGANVAISNLAFTLTKESFKGVNALMFNGNDVVVEDCEFAAAGGTCAAGVGHLGVLGTGSSQRRLLVARCAFKGFRAGNNDCCAILVNEYATIEECVFEDVSSVIRANNGSGASFNFISNLVLNAESEDLTGGASGVIIRGGWNYFSGSTIAYNRFVNTGVRAGCIVSCGSKTGQNGINVHHNTVIGYKALASFSSTTLEPWAFTFFDNILVGSDCIYKDEKTTATYASQKDAYVRNNYYSGILRDVPEGYSTSARFTMADNVVLTEAPKFMKTSDKTSPDYYRLKVSARADPMMIGGWTDGGKYPAYIGALEPQVAKGLRIIFR